MSSSVQTMTAPPDLNMAAAAEVPNNGAVTAASPSAVAINPVSDDHDLQQPVIPTSDFHNNLLPEIFSLETSPVPGNITSNHDAYHYYEEEQAVGPAPRLVSYAEPSIPYGVKPQQTASHSSEGRPEEVNGNVLDGSNMNDLTGDSHQEAASSSSLAGSEPRIQAFAKLEFDDGHFYVNTYSVILGRDIRALRAAIKKETTSQPSRAASRSGLANGGNNGTGTPRLASGAGGAMNRKFPGQSSQQYQHSLRQSDEKDYMGGSVVSDQGGIMGFDPDVPQQFSHILSWKSSNPSSLREGRPRPPMLHMSSAPTPPTGVGNTAQNAAAADLPVQSALSSANPDFVDVDADVDMNDVVQKDYNALAMESLQSQQDSNDAKPVDTFSLLPSPHACPTIPIHPPANANGLVSTQRGISRKHVKIAYNFDRNVFEMEVLGRNGAFIGADWLAPGQIRPLHSGDYIQIGGVRLRFLLPDVPVPEDIDVDDDEQLQIEDDEGLAVDNGDDEVNRDAGAGGGAGDLDIDDSAVSRRRSLSLSGTADRNDESAPAESPAKARSKTKVRRRSNSDSPSIPERPPKSKKEKRKKISKINLKLGPQLASVEGVPSSSSTGGKSKIGKSLKSITNATGGKKLSKEEKREEKRNKSDAPLMTAPVVGPDGTILIPARRRGPGRPPKDGIMSKRERAELAREKKLAAKREVSAFGELISPTNGQPSLDSQVPQQPLPQQQQQQQQQQQPPQQPQLPPHVLSTLPTANEKENVVVASPNGSGAVGVDETTGAKAEKRKYTKRKRGDENVMPSIEEGSESAAVGAGSAMASGSGATTTQVAATAEGRGGGAGEAGAVGSRVDPSPTTAKLSAKKRKMSRSPSPNYPPESAYSADDLAKPPYNYAVLIFDALSDAQSPMTLKQIYRALKSKYPYFRFRCETEGWTSSVRHNLNGNSHLFEHAERDGKGWSWKLIAGASVDKEKKRRPTPPPSIPPSQSQSMHNQLNTQGTTAYGDTSEPLQPSASAFKLSPAITTTTRYTTLQPQPQPQQHSQPQPQAQPQPQTQSQSQYSQPPNSTGVSGASQPPNTTAMNTFRQQPATVRPQASGSQFQPTYAPPSSAAEAAVAAAAALTEGRLDGNGNPAGPPMQGSSATAPTTTTTTGAGSGPTTQLPPSQPPQQQQQQQQRQGGPSEGSSSLPFASATAAVQNHNHNYNYGYSNNTNNNHNNPPQSQGQQQHSFSVVPPPQPTTTTATSSSSSYTGQKPPSSSSVTTASPSNPNPTTAASSTTTTSFFPSSSRTTQYQKPPIPPQPTPQQQPQPQPQPSQSLHQHQHQHHPPSQPQQQQQQQHPLPPPPQPQPPTTTTTASTPLPAPTTAPAPAPTAPTIPAQAPKSQSFLDRANAAIDNFEAILMEDTGDRAYLQSVLRSARRRVLHGVTESEVPGGETKDERVIVDAIRKVVGGLGGE